MDSRRSHATEVQLSQRGTVLLATGGAAVLGLAAGKGYAPLMAAAFGGFVIGVIASKLGVEIVAGVLVVICLDGLPGLNLQSFNAHGSFQYTDIPVLALVASAVWRWSRSRGEREESPFFRPLLMWSAVMIAFWLVALREAVAYGASMQHAALFGRDYLYWAILVPLTPFLFADRAGLRRFILTIVVLTTLFCAVLILAAPGIVPSSLTNPNHTYNSYGITRIYTFMGDTNLIDVVFCGAVAYLLLRRGRSARWAVVVAAVCGLAILLLLTRALWAGIAIGLVVTGGLWSVRGTVAELPRRRLAWSLGTILAALVLVALLAPGSLTSNSSNPVISRAANGVTDFQSNAGSLAVRSDVAANIVHHIGGRWIFGLGFRDPSHYYVLGNPQGSIQDSDVSLLNSVSTMGSVGTIILFLPLIAVFLAIVRRAGSASEGNVIYLGGTLWILSGLVAVYTLGFIESTYGIVTVAVVMGAIIRTMELDAQPAAFAERASSSARTIRGSPSRVKVLPR